MRVPPPPRTTPGRLLVDPEMTWFYTQLLNSLYQGWEEQRGVRSYLLGDRLFSGNPALAIDTNFDAQSTATVVIAIDGVLHTIAAATCDTGTTATFPAAMWGIFLVSSDSAGTLTATWSTSSGAGYGTEVKAKAALGALPASEAPIGYVTVLAHASNSFTAGTDALQGGTGGNPSADTNYYNLADPLATIGTEP